MSKLEDLKKDLRTFIDKEKAPVYAHFFKTGEGEYAYGDKFLGVNQPNSQKVVKKYYKEVSLKEAEELLHSEWHEERTVALLIMKSKFLHATLEEQKEIYKIYLRNTKYINNWDLVDSTAEYIVGEYLKDKPQDILFKLAKSELIWDRRIAMLATFQMIKLKDNKTAFEIAEILLHDDHDLIQKAVGWMLKEIGKRSGIEAEEPFLKKHYKTMPRTMLRYAIEKFPPEKKKFYMTKD